MKMSHMSQWGLLVGLLLAACTRVEQRKAVPPAARPAVAVKGDVPAEAEVAKFIAKYQDPLNANKSTEFNATFGRPRLRPQIMEEFRERGKIPFAISVDFSRYEMAPGGRDIEGISSIMDGHADIAVLDADGKCVDRQRKDLALLCPS